MPSRILRGVVHRALEGVGNPLAGEWEEWTGKAFHLRRRLRGTEQQAIGEACDLRGTGEAEARFQASLWFLPPAGFQIAMEEMSEVTTK